MGRQVTSGQHSPADDQVAVEAARFVDDLRDHPGWPVFLEALDRREQDIQTALLYGKAAENAAEYASEIGLMRGLREAGDMAQVVVKRGRAAAERIRNRQNESAEEAA